MQLTYELNLHRFVICVANYKSLALFNCAHGNKLLDYHASVPAVDASITPLVFLVKVLEDNQLQFFYLGLTQKV